MAKNNTYAHRINPRVRAVGKARIDIARRARTRQDWDSLWKRPQHGFPFHWGAHWKQCIEYRVDDFAAEVGFYIDILGLPVNAFNEYFAMFTGPQQEFYFAVTPTFEDQEPTQPDAVRIQFLVDDIFQVADELVQRGIEFEQPPQPVAEGSSYFVGYFRTPHGIPIDICGQVNLDELELVTPEEPVEAGEDEESEIEPVQGFPQDTHGSYPPAQSDPDDAFIEVRPQPGGSRAASERQTFQTPTPPARAPSGQSSIFSQPQPRERTGPPAPDRKPGTQGGYQYPPAPPSEPIYEPVDDEEDEV